jgi:restriction system protein
LSKRRTRKKSVSWWRVLRTLFARPVNYLEREWDIPSLLRMPPHDFEKLVGQVYRDLGYRVQDNPSGAADGGIDLIVDTQQQRWIVQCKRWSKPVGVDPVRALWGLKAATGATGMIVVAVRGFTQQATTFAQWLGSSAVLIDGEELLRMMRHAARPASR